MRIKDIPENTSYYTVPHAFRRDGAGKLWISVVYEASSAPNSSRHVEIIRTPDNLYHISGGALSGMVLGHAQGGADLAPCWEDQKRGGKASKPKRSAKDPGFDFF